MKEVELYQVVSREQGVPKVPIYSSREGVYFGPGYYFWVELIGVAHSYGKSKYGPDGYIICRSCYDVNSDKCFDLVGSPKHRELFRHFAEKLKQKPGEQPTVAEVLAFLQKLEGFPFNESFWAIKAQPIKKRLDKKIDIPISSKTEGQAETQIDYISCGERMQMCVLNLDFLCRNGEYISVYPETCASYGEEEVV